MQERPTPEQELELIENSINAHKQNVAIGEALQRLLRNRDFKRVIMEHYLRDEAVRAVKLMAAPECQNPTQQEALQKIIIGIGQLDQFLRVTLQIADRAQLAIQDDEAAYAEIAAEINTGDNN